ncbi:MAG TPA: phosphoribosylaminoimidazolesuccinocarboxamide synthase [Candidatus Sulfopaludibacter sp.]|nr:phosphoribosylaminoimidazolesuccinocarboxamide synthase [Candidatus Sulfopaludibacter sp.]
MRLIKKGKVKDIYEADNETLIFHFTNRVSAFDIIMKDTIPYKGKILCDFALFWFSTLNVPNHFIKKIDVDKILVRKLSIFPVECIVRGYMYGSLLSRYKAGNYIQIPEELHSYFNNNKFEVASKLPLLIFDPSTKSDEHDLPITKEQALIKNLLDEDEFDKLKFLSFDLYNKMNKITNLSNFILADVKFEFGKDPITGEIVLADSLGPDECRLWDIDTYQPGKLQDSFDKQILRDWLDKIGFKNTVNEYMKQGKNPDPPSLPSDIIDKISDRYIQAYERITNMDFKKE